MRDLKDLRFMRHHVSGKYIQRHFDTGRNKDKDIQLPCQCLAMLLGKYDQAAQMAYLDHLESTRVTFLSQDRQAPLLQSIVKISRK